MKPLGSILPGLFESLGLTEGARGWRAVTEWPAVAGARVARHARAVSFHDGTLTVEVDGSTWMHQLGFLKPELVRNLNRHLGGDVVRDVRLVPARGGNQR
ncbi:MAG: DUF721 domain-containing protein [bacterium]